MLEIQRGSRQGEPSFEAAIKKCGKTRQWREALNLFREASQLRSKISPGCYIVTVSACGKDRQWQQALALLSELWEAKLESYAASYCAGITAGITACQKGQQWKRGLALLSEMWEAELEPD
ncbi:unnamed protein product [Prorocentrum cordatum]|uniref:Uncharacterized protein n=1 Tax=Prorocentrum cordatum TaxID=2364126 RepID=A0ABN9T6T6_9DINO|nr:unnamed protein product [Polarella glacialis]